MIAAATSHAHSADPIATFPRAVACGDCAVAIEFGDAINEAINARVVALDRALAAQPPLGVVETVPTYRSLLIHYDPLQTGYEELAGLALELARNEAVCTLHGRILRLPVCYDAGFGIDIDAVAARLGLTPAEFAARHAAPLYRVYMLGFQPGFAYLGGLDPALSLPRRAAPRFGAPAGTISIAAGQCAVHAVEGPSAWHWIARTPARTWRPDRRTAFALEPGDRIRFVPIDAAHWRELDNAAAAGQDVIEVES